MLRGDSSGSAAVANTISKARDYGIVLSTASGYNLVNSVVAAGRAGLRIVGTTAPTVTPSCGNRIIGGPAPLTWVDHNPRTATCAQPNLFLGTLRQLEDGAPGFEEAQDSGTFDP